MKDIVRFDLVKINRGRDKLCRCVTPAYEVDTVNRIVTCMKCGAILDPFDALTRLAERPEKLMEAQKKMQESIEYYSKKAQEERERMIRSKTFREMQNHYNTGLLPYCPECQQQFDPAKINRWGRKALMESASGQDTKEYKH